MKTTAKIKHEIRRFMEAKRKELMMNEEFDSKGLEIQAKVDNETCYVQIILNDLSVSYEFPYGDEIEHLD